MSNVNIVQIWINNVDLYILNKYMIISSKIRINIGNIINN